MEDDFFDSYYKKGLYGLIIHTNENFVDDNDRVKAYNLLKFGYEISKKSTHAHLCLLPEIAFDISNHESIYRIAAFLYIELGEKQNALECLSYLHYYYQDQVMEPHNQYHIIRHQLIVTFKSESEINLYIDSMEKQYQERKILNNIKDYPEFLPEIDVTDQNIYFSKIYRRFDIDTVFTAITSDVRFNNRQKAIFLIRASRAVAAISDEGPSIESSFANKALELDTSNTVVRNSYQAYLRAGDLDKITQLKEQYPELL